MAPTNKEEPTIRYAGEKFLHSSLLLIQTLIVIYAKEFLISLSFISTNNAINNIIEVIFGIILSFISSMAALTWFWGFDELNNDLWKKWKKRIEIMRESKAIEKAKYKKDKNLLEK
jgi:hypothetical protein